MILCENICVYVHVDPATQDIFYVGIGKSYRPFNNRSRSDEWLQYVKSIYFNYDVIVLYYNLSYHEASVIEKQLISQIGRKDKGTGNLLNKSDGGEGCNHKILELQNTIKALENTIKQNNNDNELFCLKEEIKKRALSCETIQDFTEIYYTDFLLSQRLGIIDDIDLVIKERNIKIQNKLANKKIKNLKSYLHYIQ